MRTKKCLMFHNNLHIRFQVRHQKWGRFVTRSSRCESSEKYNSTKLKGVQLQDEHAPLEFQVLHHKDVALRSNPKMTLEAVLHSFVRLGPRKR